MKRRPSQGGSVELLYTIIPANAPSFAADIVQDARRISGVDLDYSVGSLARVDDIIEGFREDGDDADEIPGTLFGFGCYVGEVFVRHAGFKWRKTQEDEMDAIGMPMVVERDGYVANPIGKVFKRMRNGEGDDLAYFYRCTSRPPDEDELDA